MNDGNILFMSLSEAVRSAQRGVDCQAGGYVRMGTIWYMQTVDASRKAIGTCGLIMMG